MNRKELVEKMQDELPSFKYTKKEVDEMVVLMINTIKSTVKRGEDVSLIGFGTFRKARVASRIGVNPATGERLRIKSKIVPKFRAGKAWKEMM